MKITLLLFLTIVSFLVNGQSNNPNIELDRMITKGMDDWKIPGLTVVVVKDGNVVFSKSYGVKNIDTKIPVDEETMFGMASTTKALICIALGMIVDDGIINWDDKVRFHMPSFKLSDAYITEDARVQDLLLHNLGIGGLAAYVPYVENQATTETLIKRFSNARITYPLRSGFIYQNMMFVYAEGISINNLMLEVKEPDFRVPIIADDVTGLQIRGSQLINTVDTKPFVRGKSLEEYQIEKPLNWKGEDKNLVEIIKSIQ